MKKMSPAVLIAIIAVVIAILLMGIYTLVLDKDLNKGLSGDKGGDKIEPTIILQIITQGENLTSVKIKAEAKTEDKNGIRSITLPDGNIVEGAVAEFEVFKNDKYTFKATGNNEAEKSETIEVTTILVPGANNPYIPDGFEHVEGEVDTGFVIQDEYENQFVWVPVENGNISMNAILPMGSKYDDTNDFVSELNNSVGTYYGFYIARYEASKDDNELNPKVVVKANQKPWTEITYIDANTAAVNMCSDYDYGTGVKTAIVNRYAWDSVLTWINKTTPNYSSNTGYGNYGQQILLTGSTELDKLNNICDLAGNVREWTSTKFTDSSLSQSNTTTDSNVTANYRVIRGGSATLSRTAGSHSAYPENTTDMYWGFRVILYKN